MRISPILASLCLLLGLTACSSGGGSSSGTDETSTPVVPEISTEMLLTVDAPDYMLAGISTAPTLQQQIQYFFISPAYATPVPGATIAVVYLGPDGLVTEVLDADDGLVVDDLGDGTYKVIMPGNPRVDGLLVADPTGQSAAIETGYELPDGTLYVPAVGEEITADLKSTAATRIIFDYTKVNGFGGLTADEMAELVIGLGRLVEEVLEGSPALRLDELVMAVEGGSPGYILSMIKQAASDSMVDVSGYVGDYFNMAFTEALSTAPGSSEMQSISTVGDWNISIPLPAPDSDPMPFIDLSKFTLTFNVGGTASSKTWSDIWTVGGWSASSGAANRGEVSYPDIDVSDGNGRMVIGLPAEPLLGATGAPLLNHNGIDMVAFGSDPTTGVIVTGMDAWKQVDAARTADGNGESLVSLAIKKSNNFDINLIDGEYGALINWRTLTLPVITELRGRERFTATSGSFVRSLQHNMDGLVLNASGSVTSDYQLNSISDLVFTAEASLNGALEGGWSGFTSSAAASADGRFVHAVLDHPEEGVSGFASFVKLDDVLTGATIGQREYALIGSSQQYSEANRKQKLMNGLISFNVFGVDTGIHTITTLDKWISTDFSGLLTGGSAEFKHGSEPYFGFYLESFEIANGEVSFNLPSVEGSESFQFRGFLQEGGNLMVLHSYMAKGTPGTAEYEVQDGLYYAICVVGCDATAPAATFTIEALVSGLNDTLGLTLDISDYANQPVVGGSETLSISSDGRHVFTRQLSYSQRYKISIGTQPDSQECSVSNDSGVALSDIYDIDVVCVDLYSIGGNVTGLSGKVDLQINNAETIAITEDGPFTFANKLPAASIYDVIILNQPIDQTCSITNASGTADADVTDVQVDCVSQFKVGGSISGLLGQVELELNAGTETLSRSVNGPFEFTTTLDDGTTYDVTVSTQPAGQQCTVSNGGGTITAVVSDIVISCISVYTIGGAVSGLSGQVDLQLNSGALLPVIAGGAFTFPTGLLAGTAYDVQVVNQPVGQVCTVTNGSGLANSNVSNVTVACSNLFSVGGTVSGLSGTVQLRLNGDETLGISADGVFSFASFLGDNAAYSVAVSSQPVGSTCTLANASGVATANVTDIAVNCSLNQYTIGGSVNSLTGTLQLQLNGGETINVSQNSFVFTGLVQHGNSYLVQILTQPAGQTCSILNGSGDGIAVTNVGNVSVGCGGNQYTVGGNVSGLNGGETVQVQLNGGETRNVSADGSFTFSATIGHGGAYNVTISNQPNSQTCGISNASGTATNSISNIAVDCSANVYTIGGSASGLSGGETVQLQLNSAEFLAVANGPFTFATTLTVGTAYNVAVTTQPASNTCSISNASGTLAGTVNNVSITCSTNLYTIGGAVSGLSGSVDLQLNGGETLNRTADGSFTFASSVAAGGAYSVSVTTQPVGQTCSISAGSGTANANVANVSVSCADQRTIGGSVVGLINTVYLQLNGGEVLPVIADGAFTFIGTVDDGAAYSVAIDTQPTGQTCTLSGASGNAATDITSVNVNCSDNQYIVGGTVSSLTGTVQLQLNSGANLVISANGAFTFPPR